MLFGLSMMLFAILVNLNEKCESLSDMSNKQWRKWEKLNEEWEELQKKHHQGWKELNQNWEKVQEKSHQGWEMWEKLNQEWEELQKKHHQEWEKLNQEWGKLAQAKYEHDLNQKSGLASSIPSQTRSSPTSSPAMPSNQINQTQGSRSDLVDIRDLGVE